MDGEFEIECKSCGNKRLLFDGFHKDGLPISIKIIGEESIEITCHTCKDNLVSSPYK